jgi:hypothetical protein
MCFSMTLLITSVTSVSSRLGRATEEGEEEETYTLRRGSHSSDALLSSSCRRRGFVCRTIGGDKHTTGPPNPGADFIVVEIVQGIR